MDAKKLKKEEIENKLDSVAISCSQEVHKKIKADRTLSPKRISLYKRCAKQKINNRGMFRRFLHEMKK